MQTPSVAFLYEGQGEFVVQESPTTHEESLIQQRALKETTCRRQGKEQTTGQTCPKSYRCRVGRKRATRPERTQAVAKGSREKKEQVHSSIFPRRVTA